MDWSRFLSAEPASGFAAELDVIAAVVGEETMETRMTMLSVAPTMAGASAAETTAPPLRVSAETLQMPTADSSPEMQKIHCGAAES